MGRPHGALMLLEPAPDGKATGAGSGDSRRDALLNLVRGGASPRQAAMAVGITSSTWQRWMVEGGVDQARGWGPTNDRAPAHIREFWQAIERARAQWVARVSVATTTGIPRNPMAGMRLLRQIDPDGQWPGDEERPEAPQTIQGRVVERQVIMLPEAQVRAFLAAGLAVEAADAGDAEDEEGSLDGLAEVVVPPGARRKRA